MDIGHSINQNQGIIWHLDADTNVKGAEDEATETRVLRQPWRAYWPPRCDKTMEIWLHSEFPQVLSWRFDHHQPFDRPWRSWTRSARATQERAAGLSFRPARESTSKQQVPVHCISLIAFSSDQGSASKNDFSPKFCSIK
jgi:hypothetical protein